MEAPANVARQVRLLLDEMHSPAIAEALVARGWDVVAVAAEPSLRGSSDTELLEYASRSDQILVTENVVISQCCLLTGSPTTGLAGP